MSLLSVSHLGGPSGPQSMMVGFVLKALHTYSLMDGTSSVMILQLWNSSCTKSLSQHFCIMPSLEPNAKLCKIDQIYTSDLHILLPSTRPSVELLAPQKAEKVGKFLTGNAMGCTNGHGFIAHRAGVKDLRRSHYSGTVSVRNDCAEAVKLRFAEPNLLGKTLLTTQLAPGEVFEFQPGESCNFDFHTTIGDNKLRAHVLRGGSYAVTDGDGKDQVIMRTLSRPERQQSDRLSKVKGLSFSFSASGWLVIYQLGAAECLQNHGRLVLESGIVSFGFVLGG